MSQKSLDDSTENKEGGRRVCVVVMGDLGRSPRMQYHSLSLASHGFYVDIVAYGGSKPHVELMQHENINLCLMSDVPNFAKYVPRLFSYALKTVWQSIVLFFCLLTLQKPEYVLMQNPPATPTMPVVWFYCLVLRAKFVVDWHNYGYTILSLSLSQTHPLVKLTRWCEGFFGSKAQHGFCVSKAMQNDLKQRWNIDVAVLYDRPSERFTPKTLVDKHNIFQKLSSAYSIFGANSESETRFTYENERHEICEKPNRPVCVISSTSWTEDEDFSLLLEALREYDLQARANAESYAKVVCIITGKGPLKEYYEAKIKDMEWKYVEFCLPWLEPEDYPLLLGACDLGVCLHTSSSGLDLPMKVIDMFGCALPVCAVKYQCLNELVVHDVNGFVFENSKELQLIFKTVFRDFPANADILHRFRNYIKDNFLKCRWNQSWTEVCTKVFELKGDF